MMTSKRRVTLDEVVVFFEELEDPRSSINRRHPLASVVVISILAILACADGPTAIARWADLKENLLVRLLDLPHGIPGKDVFRRVLMVLDPAAFQACFARWLWSPRDDAAASTGVERPLLAVDGKTPRRSHDGGKGLGALHTVSVWASELGLSLGQVACGEKSNEITAIPQLLGLVDIKGAIVTIDAMGTQKAIAEPVVAGGADYVLALKGNQGMLHQAVIEAIAERLEGELPEGCERTIVERGHGRGESRTYLQLPVPECLPGRAEWKDLKSVGVVTSRRVRGGDGGPLLDQRPGDRRPAVRPIGSGGTGVSRTVVIGAWT